MGHTNTQAEPMKLSLVEQFPDEPEVQAGIIGLLFRAQNGEVKRDASIHSDRSELQRYAENRFNSKRKILLPTPIINKEFAELGFTGDMADRMSNNEFQDDVVPRVAVIFEAHLPKLNVDILMRRRSKAASFYSSTRNVSVRN